MKNIFRYVVLLPLSLSILVFFACRSNGKTTGGITKKEFVVKFYADKAQGSLEAKEGEKTLKSGDKVKEGALITFEAKPNENYEVNSWTGGVKIVDNTEKKKASIVVASDINVTVSFKKKQSKSKEEVMLNFNVEGENGTLKAFVNDVEKQTGNKIAKGSLVKFVAKANKDYEVNEWTGGVTKDTQDKSKASMVADSDINVTVSFKETQPKSKEEVMLNFNVEGENGTLKAFVNDVEKQTGNKIAKGSLVKFVAKANKDYEVNEWTGGVTKDTQDKSKASIVADSDVNVTVSFKEKQSKSKEVDITKVVIGNKEWDASTKTITMPKDSTSFGKENVKVWGKATGSSDVEEELDVDNVLPEPIVPTEEGIEVTITTKATIKFQVGSVKVIVKKLGEKNLGEKKDVILTKITIKGQQANMLSNVVIFNPDKYGNTLKFTKADVKVEGRAFGETTSTPLEVESIHLFDETNPAEEVEVKRLGTIFTIKTKSTEKYNECSHSASAALRIEDLILEYINFEYRFGQYCKSEVKDGILVVTVNNKYKDNEYTESNVKFQFKDAMPAFVQIKEVVPKKMKPSNEGFGQKCVARINIYYTNLEIPFYLRYKE